MKQNIEEIITPLVRLLDGQWKEATKEEIEITDGRKDKNNPICQNSSCLYMALAGEDILYIGETSKSIKRRFISDGTGSHKSACENWYHKMTKVKFVMLAEANLPDKYRKLLEQALSISYKPEFYGDRTCSATLSK